MRFRLTLAIFLSSLSCFSLAVRSFAQESPIQDTITITASIPETNENIPPPPPPPPSGGGGGGGWGGGVSLSTANIDSAIFRGMAYPGSIVSLLQNGTLVTEIPSSPDGSFEIRLQNLSNGTYTFGIRADDAQGLRSSTQVITVYVTQGISTLIDGIFLAPTVTTDKIEAVYGDPIRIFGSTAPSAKVSLVVSAAVDIVKSVVADANGTWTYTMSTSILGYGAHTAKARAITSNDTSVFSDPIAFVVGRTTTNRAISLRGNRKCDINGDGRVNLLDFSIMAFWYKRTGFPSTVDLNGDNRIDLSDVSILAYCWTG